VVDIPNQELSGPASLSLMRYTFLLWFLAIAACDSNPVSPAEVEGRTITYRVETDPPVVLLGVTYLTSATQVDPDLSERDVVTPWEVTVPYFEGLKNVGTQIPNVDAIVTILVDGEIVARNYYSPAEVGAEPNSIVGAVAGLPQYDVQFILSALAPYTKLDILLNGASINSFSAYQENVSQAGRTIRGGRVVLPGDTLTFVKGAERGILGVSMLSPVGYVRHIYSVTTSEPFQLDFAFGYNGR